MVAELLIFLCVEFTMIIDYFLPGIKLGPFKFEQIIISSITSASTFTLLDVACNRDQWDVLKITNFLYILF